jgi:hypothetical protein
MKAISAMAPMLPLLKHIQPKDECHSSLVLSLLFATVTIAANRALSNWHLAKGGN